MASYSVTIVKTGTINVPDATSVEDAMSQAEKLGVKNPGVIQWDDNWEATDAQESEDESED